MIVMKFGGTSVGSAAAIRSVSALVRKARSRNPLLVVSAQSGVTDQLIALAQGTLQNENEDAGPLAERLRTLCQELEIDPGVVAPDLEKIRGILQGIYLLRELTGRSLDLLMAMGERMSARIVAAFLTSVDLEATPVMADEAGLLTDSSFGHATPAESCQPELARYLRTVPGIAVVTGFIGRDPGGNVTTLGRSGSDYSAAFLGAALEAEEVQIWTDVDGVLTADPSLVPEARPLARLSFDEASELAYYGARVLHPGTILPAISRDLPVRVLNTRRPDAGGTVILRQADEGVGRPVTSIVYKENLYLIGVVSTRKFHYSGFMARLFQIFDRYRIAIDMIASSEISVSLTTDNAAHLDEAMAELGEFSAASYEGGKALVCVVGHRLREDPSVAPRIFRVLHDCGVDPLMVSQASTRTNLAVLVTNQDVPELVPALHREFLHSG